MIYLIDFDEIWIYDVVMNHLKVWMTNPVLNVFLSSRKVVVQGDNFMTVEHQFINQV